MSEPILGRQVIDETVELGQTGIQLQPFGLGTWAWGDRYFWGYGGSYSEADVRSAFDASVEVGVNFFDTAEVYGLGTSERLLGRFLREAGQEKTGQPAVVGTKFFPFPWRFTPGSLLRALRRSLNRLGMEKVDLYQVHFPPPVFPVEALGKALAQAVQAGLTTAVGVSNYHISQMQRIMDVLESYGVHLAANQVEYSLINRRVEKNGLLQLCQENKVTLIAYSPIAKGLLSGKYTPANPPPGLRGRTYHADFLARLQPLVKLLREIGQSHDAKTPSQVALNWTICKGTVPIPGAKNARQAMDNAGALGWRLSEAEVAALDAASEELS